MTLILTAAICLSIGAAIGYMTAAFCFIAGVLRRGREEVHKVNPPRMGLI